MTVLIKSSDNKGIELFWQKAAEKQKAAQSSENKGIEAFREKLAEKQGATQ